MPYHTGSPCCGYANGKQADNFKQRPEYSFSAGPVAAIHNVVAGADGSGGKIDENHIFAEKHSFRTKTEQRKQRPVQKKPD